jgi:hypothetical protein
MPAGRPLQALLLPVVKELRVHRALYHAPNRVQPDQQVQALREQRFAAPIHHLLQEQQPEELQLRPIQGPVHVLKALKMLPTHAHPAQGWTMLHHRIARYIPDQVQLHHRALQNTLLLLKAAVHTTTQVREAVLPQLIPDQAAALHQVTPDQAAALHQDIAGPAAPRLQVTAGQVTLLQVTAVRVTHPPTADLPTPTLQDRAVRQEADQARIPVVRLTVPEAADRRPAVPDPRPEVQDQVPAAEDNVGLR